MYDLHSRWEVARWLGADPRPMTSVQQADRGIAHWAEYATRDSRYGLWAVEEKAAPPARRVAGSVLLVPLPLSRGEVPAPDGPEVEIGWHLHPDAWGRGLATEAAGAILDRAWRDGHEQVFAVTWAGNDPSRRVCERLGMTALGPTSRWYDVTMDAFTVGAP